MIINIFTPILINKKKRIDNREEVRDRIKGVLIKKKGLIKNRK
jgi:hypothetical protein